MVLLLFQPVDVAAGGFIPVRMLSVVPDYSTTKTRCLPFRINIVNVQVRATISFLGSLSVLDSISHAKEGPNVLVVVLYLEVFIARLRDDLLIVHRTPRPDGIHAPGVVVLVLPAVS